MWKECKICSSYLVSTEGEVKHKKTNKILKPRLRKDGYLEVSISMGSRNNIKHISVHRLVAEAFVPNPYNKPQVNHINGNKQDNRCVNLEWVTAKENQDHARKIGLKPDDHGSSSPNSKLTDIQILYCRMMHKPRDKQYGAEALARKFGVSKSTMHYILHGVTYKFPSRQTGKVTSL